jgi:hypothetical protein
VALTGGPFTKRVPAPRFPPQEDDDIAHQAAKSRDDWQFNLLKWFISQVTEK